MRDDLPPVPSAAAPRHALILERLRTQPVVEVTALAEEMGVSAVTIRSDLDALDRKQLLRRIRGGAMAVRPARFEPPADLPGQDLEAEKARIGAMAARMVRSGETIILDAGRTAMALARALPDDLHDVLVVTSSVDIVIALQDHPGVTILVTGGKLKKTGRNAAPRSLISPFGTLLLEQINADCAFLCCAGIDAVRGFTNASLDEVEIKRAMLKAARRVVMLGDASKIGHVAGARIADLSEVTTLISDSGAKPADVAALEATGLQVLLA
ncbi:MAG: DeoR/GlpR family DNA-binding transcription regulator [Rhodobacteraceae bacterium]|jgi:DeoR/GlpR family transcriptional regulator of sugar metabolism|nr:DeoR/GlpR family DNA-binding transcription regulator [Paracoccaceae bacterium]